MWMLAGIKTVMQCKGLGARGKQKLLASWETDRNKEDRKHGIWQTAATLPEHDLQIHF